MERALRATFVGIADANELRREPCPLSELTLGLECGGQRWLLRHLGQSGARPLRRPAGGARRHGVLCEVSRALRRGAGALRPLRRRRTCGAFLDLMRRYERAARACGSGFDTNPSPGNIRDGLITDAMKSLGAAKKGGTSPVIGCARLSRAGHEARASRSSARRATTSNRPPRWPRPAECDRLHHRPRHAHRQSDLPDVKMCTNTELAERMGDIIDFDAGAIIRGEKTIEQTGAELLDHVIEVASGRITPAAVRSGRTTSCRGSAACRSDAVGALRQGRLRASAIPRRLWLGSAERLGDFAAQDLAIPLSQTDARRPGRLLPPSRELLPASA